MESVKERMERIGAYEKIASFMQKEKQPYEYKRKYAQIRAEEFARIALNAMEADSVICEIKEAYSIDDSKFVLEEEEFDYGN